MTMNTRTDHARTRSPIQVLFSTLIVFSLLFTTAGAALAAPQQPAAEQAQQPSVKPPEKPSAVAAASPSLQDTTNILLLGSDRRPNTPNWRTDVMMILAIDEATKQVGVISLPRDIYVDEIPDHRGNKINVIDYLGEQDEPNGGGPKLLGQIIEKKIGVPIDHYIRFDFEAFKKLVDAMGGVEIEVDCPLYDPQGYDQGGLPLALDKGVHRLNGGEALSYVRSRLVGGTSSASGGSSASPGPCAARFSTRTCWHVSRPCTRLSTTTCRLTWGCAMPSNWCALRWD